jgi:hypothetical protein
MAMKLLLVIAATSLLPSSAVNVTPLEKVVQMLDSVLAKGKQEKHAEEVEFSKFHQWCDSVQDEKTKSIKELADEILQLDADAAKADADAETLAEEIADLQKEIAKHKSELKSATAVREKENTDYKAAHLDVSESIDAIAKAIQVLKTRGADVPQSLLQVANSNLLDEKAKNVINTFLAMGSDLGESAPEANAYEFQSGGVVELLEKLKLKFEDQKLSLEKEEMNSKASFQMLAQQLTDDVKADSDSVEKKTATKAKRIGNAADARGDNAVATASKKKDEETLSDTLAECKATSEDFENNQVTRAGEIKAIEKAIEILSSGAVQGNADKHLPAAALLQKKAGTAFASLRSKTADPMGQRVSDFLQARAKKMGSKYLALVAARAKEDPFGKIKSMIKDLIVKLMEEANAEADHHGYCQTELSTNKQTREIKSSEVDELSANLEEQQALFEKLTTEITDLSDSMSETKKQQSEATSLRQEEKKTNAATIADAKEAQAAVSKATQVLKDFYAKSADLSLVQGQDAASLHQEMQQAALPTYKGNQDSSTGIFGMLEVVLSDFARLETETTSSEASQKAAYEKMMDETNEDVAVKESENTHKSRKKDKCDADIRGLKKNLKLTQSELDKALDYYGKLKQDCVDTGNNYADRKEMREQELVSLQEALKMLDGEDI